MGRETEEGEIDWDEIETVFRKLKKGNAAGEDGIQNEAWMWERMRFKGSIMGDM